MDSFAERLLDWFDQHGRHDLPWQKDRTLYRVWLSEIMLQQTQVKTVIPYFLKFTRRFPNLKRLASASRDEVLQYWAGLGYYSRARNLHKAAQLVASDFGGRMPRDIECLVALPGIGRSTAAAILSQSLDQRHAILDGNVKRVLARFHAIDGYPGTRSVEIALWERAESHTPARRNRDYTQAIMDLGATLCTRSRPACEQCPLGADCEAYRRDAVSEFPGRKPSRKLPVKQARFLMLTDDRGAVMLEKRPPAGIWGGLWSLPEAELEQDLEALCEQRWGMRLQDSADRPGFRHSFSHYHLDIQPSICHIASHELEVRDDGDICWHLPGEPLPATATPVARLLTEYHVDNE